VPVGSTTKVGFVVVAVPPVKVVPVRLITGADAAPFALLIRAPVRVPPVSERTPRFVLAAALVAEVMKVSMSADVVTFGIVVKVG
jgi:hypothetical protein